MTRFYAANYIFDGSRLIKNACISRNDDDTILVGEENSGLIERPQMIFYNGIICPSPKKTSFIADSSIERFLKESDLRFNRFPIAILENCDLQKLTFTQNSRIRVLK